MITNTKDNIVLIGDSGEMMKELPDNCIDLTVTSPPYDTLRKYNGYVLDLDVIIQELYRITKPGGICVWVVSDKTKNGSESGSSFRTALSFMEYGWKLYDTMIYAKSNAIPLSHRRYEQKFEYMFVFCKGPKPTTFNPIMEECKSHGKSGNFRQRSDGVLEKAHTIKKTAKEKIKGNIWFYTVGNNKSTKDKIAFKHPATFPEQLAIDHILSWTNEGDTVFDPFVGSGTTMKAAILNNRNAIGCDISEEYINNICIPRLKDYNINVQIIQ